MDFKELYMIFQLDGQKYQFQGINAGSPDIISSHRMEKILKNGHSYIISQFHAIQAIEIPSTIFHPNIQLILSKHHSFFDNPQGILPSHSPHDHSIPLDPGSLPPNVHLYCHPFYQKNEIEKIVQELLDADVIHPSTISYSSPLFMVLKKEGMWCMCPGFRALNEITIKDKFPIPFIDDLLDELSSAQLFTKLDLCLGDH
jgi:hypothetical protein